MAKSFTCGAAALSLAISIIAAATIARADSMLRPEQLIGQKVAVPDFKKFCSIRGIGLDGQLQIAKYNISCTSGWDQPFEIMLEPSDVHIYLAQGARISAIVVKGDAIRQAGHN